MGDAYEREYMAGKGEVLHRQKATLPRWVIGLTAGLPAAIMAAAGLSNLFSGAMTFLPALAVVGGGAVYALLMALIMVVVAVARVTVSEGTLELQMGTGGVQIPIEEIEDVTLAPSGVNARGLGARRLLDGTRVYNMLGDPARAVCVRRRDGSRVVFVPREPAALHEAIDAARARVPRVRVEAPADEAELHEVEIPADRTAAERDG